MIKRLTFIFGTLMAPLPAFSIEPVPDLSWHEVDVRPVEQFYSLRQKFIDVGGKACEGDEFFHINLLEAAVDDVAPAIASLAFGYNREKCRFFKNDPYLVTRLYEKAARLGYPVAMSVYGRRLIDGVGTDVDIPTGLLVIERAAASGYGDAGLEMAQFLIQGKILARDLEKAATIIEGFRLMNPSPQFLKSVERQLKDALAEEAASPVKSHSGAGADK